ncbi:uncharacterized protein I303_107181 [Kwoniella dejecticola CBS 10117]|uniref:Uncharacterized protein n=1 Tax=Kwoniella dejecticola CBS 10117 TaxID=1296121 RepID=A0A1A5ZYY6_9TREE|nr:uncharacterized protein I303_06582 [Kwoniella dejecticola CBS 10117]OBR83023.1 hypothetical protein I303_06582 [Kwoniella dejecticola CBS 10117]
MSGGSSFALVGETPTQIHFGQGELEKHSGNKLQYLNSSACAQYISRFLNSFASDDSRVYAGTDENLMFNVSYRRGQPLGITCGTELKATLDDFSHARSQIEDAKIRDAQLRSYVDIISQTHSRNATVQNHLDDLRGTLALYQRDIAEPEDEEGLTDRHLDRQREKMAQRAGHLNRLLNWANSACSTGNTQEQTTAEGQAVSIPEDQASLAAGSIALSLYARQERYLPEEASKE